MKDELDAESALRVADEIVRNGVPYVMLCGGEPLVVPHFWSIAERFGRAGVHLKIETNGQKLDELAVARLARLPIRSIQISLDGDSEAVYQRQRPGASLAKAHAACRAVCAAGLPLEVTFAPSRLTIDDAEAVIDRARALGAFRFNTGALMRIGTAARLWNRMEPTAEQYDRFRALLDRRARVERQLELCYIPFDIADGLRRCVAEPPATLLVLPNGWVKVAAALPQICADLRTDPLSRAWDAYRTAWRDGGVLAAAKRGIEDVSRHAAANAWQLLPVA